MKRRTFLTSSTAGLSASCVAALVNHSSGNPVKNSESNESVRGYDYQRPESCSGATLLFQGDSITDMKWGRNQADRNHYLGHSYVYLIASRLMMDMPEANLTFLNRGISGNTVGDLKSRWTKDAVDLDPDVLSVLVGVNDIGRAVRANTTVDVVRFETDYRSILKQSRERNPELKIILLEPFVLPVTRVKDAWDAWRGQTDRIRPIVESLAKEFEAIFLNMQDLFDHAATQTDPSHWIWDGVHPLPQGHELIARHWIEAVATKWG